METLPKISIIIPVYNVEPYIAECLQSVMRQTYTGEIECVLVDDCGTDKSIEVAEQIIEDYNIANQKSKIKNPISFRILHHDHNRGLSAARNTGTDAATGDYIYYLDSDDYINDDCIEVLTQPLQEYDYDMVIGDARRFYDNTGAPSIPLCGETTAVLSQSEIFAKHYIAKRKIDLVAWNKLIKRCMYIKHDLSFLEGQLEEDELFTYKYCCCIQTMCIQNRITYFYRIRDNSIIDNKSINIRKHIWSAYQTVDYVLSHPANIDKDSWDIVAARFLKYYVSLSSMVSGYKETYLDLRRRINLRPLCAWLKGKISLSSVRSIFFLVLPPHTGYFYLIIHNKIRNISKKQNNKQ